MPLHASCAAREGDAVLLLGPSGAGKSDLLLRLIGRGWQLVADDQVEVAADPEGLLAFPPAPLRGLLEVRGLGLVQGLAVASPARLRLALDLLPPGAAPPRLPEPAAKLRLLGHELPRLALAAAEPSAPEKAELALEAACGRLALAAGAFP